MTVSIRLAVLGAVALASTNAVARSPGSAVDAFIMRHLHSSRYERAEVDLDGDGVKETVVYASDPDQCGSGGCSLFVLTPDGDGFRVVMDASVTSRRSGCCRPAATAGATSASSSPAVGSCPGTT